MNVSADDSNKTSLSLKPLLGSVRLSKHWRGKVLLQLGDQAEVLGQNWPSATVDDWKQAISDPNRLFEQAEHRQILKASKSTLVVQRQLELGEAKVEVVCKLSRRRNLLRQMIGVFRRTRPSRNWQIGWELLKEGIATALPVAVLEKRIAGLRLAAVIVTVSLLPGKNLEHFMREDASDLEPAAERRLTVELAELVGRLHERGFFHRDLKGVNIFVQLTANRYTRLYLVDMDGCYHNGQKYSKKVKSLGRLARASLNWPTVSKSGRLRFLKVYLRCCGQDQKKGEKWKKWWGSIDNEVQRKLLMRRKKRNGKSSPRRHEDHEG